MLNLDADRHRLVDQRDPECFADTSGHLTGEREQPVVAPSGRCRIENGLLIETRQESRSLRRMAR
ncbi:hypothetical protein ACFYU9_05370 [Streptomyces sp. NPDC004327]|uniref:hypothetical protein n=1 Tax=Streptomyces sp. NPDC004327 TaxID=3364699 RepID=UPI0036970654